MRPAKGSQCCLQPPNSPKKSISEAKTRTLANSSKLSISGSIWMHLPYLIVAELKPSVSSSTVTYAIIEPFFVLLSLTAVTTQARRTVMPSR